METNIAKELFFTAEPIKATRALELGILNHLVETDELTKFVYSMSNKIVNNAPLNIALIKKQINALSRSNVALVNTNKIKKLVKESYYSNDFQEGKRAFLEKGKPDFKGN